MMKRAGLVLAMLAVIGPVWAGTGAGNGLTATAEGSEAPRLDVVFCVDTTGSMADEIDVVKGKLRQMVANVAAGDPQPDVRFGLVIYRDRGDEYVTKRYQLTRDIDAVVGWINEIKADGGNDYPESLNEALHVAVEEMEWDMAQGVGRLVFLIADAPPHMDYEGDYDYRKESEEALGKGIVIDTIGCSGLEAADQAIFEEIASLTTGSFELLTYMREYAKADGEKALVMHAGTALYALDAVGKPADWREGAERLAGRGMVARVPDTLAPGGIPPGPVAGLKGDAGAKGGRGDAGRAMGESLSLGYTVSGDVVGVATSEAAVGEPTVTLSREENNLDSLLTRQVQLQLARQGVRFADQPYLPRREWSGGTCAATERKALVARSEAEWQAIWALVADAEGTAELPAIDFRRDMVLAAFGGEGWQGRSARIEDVWEDADGLHARVGRGPDDETATAPYHIIVISRFDGTVTWK